MIDAKNLIMGRLASVVAKKALMGEKIDIVNCEKAVVLGDKKKILISWKQKQDRGIPSKGPLIFKNPERFLKRSIRGMLPYKKELGKRALKNIKCHIGVPESFKDKKAEEINARISKDNIKYTTVEDICKILGAK